MVLAVAAVEVLGGEKWKSSSLISLFLIIFFFLFPEPPPSPSASLLAWASGAA